MAAKGMKINTAVFVMGNTQVEKCPKPDKPEFAFIGRSNVGKSSLINMLMANPKLAKVSATPGKTKEINHFLINDNWYLVDLPGYGFAKIGADARARLEKMISAYIATRENLANLFVLIDSRLEPQQIDLEFIDWLGNNQVAFSIVFTKCDKQSKSTTQASVQRFMKRLQADWVELPPHFLTSSETRDGKEILLNYIGEIIQAYQKA
jgi:GTP-binding protein